MALARRVLLFVLCMGLVPAFSQSPTAPTTILGLWSASSVDAIGSAEQQECSALAISERRMHLSTIPDTNKFQGQLVRTATKILITTDNRNCSSSAEDSSAMSQATWAYVLDATYDAARGVMKVDGRFAYCNGNCGRFLTASAKGPFHTELKTNNDHLVDTNMTDDPGDDVAFVRANDETQRADHAKTKLAAWLKILDAGDFGRFYDQATSAFFRSNVSRKDFIDRLSTQRRRVGTTTARQMLQALYVQHAPFISKSPGEYVFFRNGVESTKSSRGLEFMLLAFDGGAWKVTWLNYGS